jgi:hypothetical protein
MKNIFNFIIVFILPFLILDYKLVLMIYFFIYLDILGFLAIFFIKGFFGNKIKHDTHSILEGVFIGVCYFIITFYFNLDINFLLVLFLIKTSNNMDRSRNIIYPDEKLTWLGEIYTIAISYVILYIIRYLI